MDQLEGDDVSPHYSTGASDCPPMYHYQFRVILIGDSTVGKSSLLKYFTEGRCAEICDPTVGVDFYARMMEIRPGYRIKLQLWDTAGQEKFRSITRSYYRNSVGVMIVYDITNRASFEHVTQWLDEALENVGGPCPDRCVFQLVGHKADLDADRQVLYEEGEYFAKYQGIKFVETSAVTGENVQVGKLSRHMKYKNNHILDTLITVW
ncbi:unnamed protein product [Gongylonema pulchrum]|uniref:Ras-related protein Rab-39B n=1 Tax=Gongylonema pulchrum TaxID=637853 RepID=A0A183EPC5_9BILA|nr:unnamed protein product [Gongylonema pulchrum]